MTISLPFLPDNVTPQAAAESLRQLVAARQRFTCSIHGPCGSGKSTVLAALVWIADELDLTLNEVALFAPTHLAIRHLRQLIGRRWPELDPHNDLFAPELCGLPIETLHAHTALGGDLASPRAVADMMRGYLGVLAHINDLDSSPRDQQFLESLKPRLLAAMRLDCDARRDRSLRWPRNAYLEAIRDHVADYKSAHRLLDVADLVHGDYMTSPDVRLVLLDEIDDQDMIITRCFPNASIVRASRQPRPAEISIALPRCLRAPERIEIVDAALPPELVPALGDFNSLFILAPRWRVGVWREWLRRRGLPPPTGQRWRAMIAAWRLDHDLCSVAPAINPLLRRAGLEAADDWYVLPGDVEGWSSWREIGAADQVMRDHADAVLERYGQLTELPTVRLGGVSLVRQIEADVVIVDDGGCWPDEESEAIALSRATRQLVVMKKR